jgi:membrane-bound lytic murein transglycosylase D
MVAKQPLTPAPVLYILLLFSSLVSPLVVNGEEGAGRAMRQVETAAPVRLAAETEERQVSIEGLDEAQTQKFIADYTTARGLKWLQGALDRGGPYIPFIRSQIEERNMPPELLYIPVIESSYLPTAISRSGAAGLWQFMANSIASLGLVKNDWVDDRLDFYKSTLAALTKLQDNYHALGGWPLALAAYNAGLGAIQRLVRSTGINDYWLLAKSGALKTETALYVPRVLAVAEILENCRKYGLPGGWTVAPAWTLVPVPRQADLVVLAKAAGLDPAVLTKANRELLHGVTPPAPAAGKLYELKVPQADAAAIAAVLQNNTRDLMQYYYYTVSYGDTFYALALHYGVSVPELEACNPGLNARGLQLGTTLRIPAVNKNVAPYQPIPTMAGTDLSFNNTYTVQPGDNLSKIARLLNINLLDLALGNGFDVNHPPLLHAGQILKVP